MILIIEIFFGWPFSSILLFNLFSFIALGQLCLVNVQCLMTFVLVFLLMRIVSINLFSKSNLKLEAKHFLKILTMFIFICFAWMHLCTLTGFLLSQENKRRPNIIKIALILAFLFETGSSFVARFGSNVLCNCGWPWVSTKPLVCYFQETVQPSHISLKPQLLKLGNFSIEDRSCLLFAKYLIFGPLVIKK